MAYSVSNKLGLVSQTEQFDGSRLDELDKTAYKLVNPNEFAYNPARINVGSIAFNNLNKTVIVSSLYVILKMSDKLDNEFILQFIKSQLFINEVKRNTEGSVREYLFFESFKNIKFPYPYVKEEQMKIGYFLSKIDDTLALHQRKLDLLKQLKQAYLQVLFPIEGEKTPKIRFAHFEGDWEQRKLGDVANFFDEKRIPIDSGKRKVGVYPYYGATGIIDYVDGYIFDGEYVLLAEDGANIIMRNSPIAYLTEGKFWLNNHAHIMRLKDGSNNFLLQLLENQKYDKYNSGTAQPKLNGQVVKKIILSIPNKDEQKKIGSFFNNLDDSIGLHQKKIAAITKLKSLYLQKMFC